MVKKDIQRIALLPETSLSERERQAWLAVGRLVDDIPALYQAVKDGSIDLVLVSEHRRDLTAPVANKLRRSNGQLEIWRLIEGAPTGERLPEYIDGVISNDLGPDNVARRVGEILNEKDLLATYRMVGRSAAMKAVAHTISRIAPTDVSVLIVGPSGAGKELVARAIHDQSDRKRGPYVAINCGALAEGVLESELFGHERGAFTGSVAKREGLFRKADGGTIFLDEIGETKPDMQVKLLRVLEDGTYYPVGSSTPQRTNVRVLAATNRDLTEALAERRFREDLYFRIGVVKIILPSLLERKSDILPLLQHFWADHPGLEYTDAALDLLMRYDWPGNVRQLRNFATRMAALKPSGLVDTHDVERFLAEQNSSNTALPVKTGRSVDEVGQELIYRAILQLGTEVKLLRDLITSHLPTETSSAPLDHTVSDYGGLSMDDMEKALIKKTLAEVKGNRKETARRLGIGERTLYRKLTRYNLN